MKLALKILNGAVTVTLIAVIAIAGLLAFSARRSQDAIPTIMGHKVLNVLSGSMEPVISTGDVIIVRPLEDPKHEVKDGHVVTYRTRENASMLITHRVIGTILVNGQPSAFVTRGDANEAPDLAPVAPDQIVGIYQWRVPLFGYLSNFLRTPIGAAIFVIIPGIVLIGFEFRKIWQALAEEEKAKAKAAAAGAEGGDQQQQ